jgi:CHAT domain-containing protein
VVATLWRINDQAAAQFAGRFYDALRSRGAADALAEAQRAMLRDPRFRDPYAWAAYDLSGAGIEPMAGANAVIESDKQ